MTLRHTGCGLYTEHLDARRQSASYAGITPLRARGCRLCYRTARLSGKTARMLSKNQEINI